MVPVGAFFWFWLAPNLYFFCAFCFFAFLLGRRSESEYPGNSVYPC